MKKNLISILALLSILNLAAYFYLARRQKESEGRLRNSILEELNERRQIEESIKKEVESKKQARDFVLLQDLQNQMGELAEASLQDKQKFEEARNKNEEYLRLLEDGYKQLEVYVKELETGFAKQLQEYKGRLEESEQQKLESLKSLEEANKAILEHIKQTETSFNQQVQEFSNRVAEYGLRLEEYKGQLDEVLNYFKRTNQ